VTDWTPAELAAITCADSVGLTVGNQPHPEVELGMVLVHDELYVRATRAAPGHDYPGRVDLLAMIMPPPWMW
jgi:hypothetical protein